MIESILNFINSKNKKITIILGSGYHKEALGNFTILSNWDMLLSKLHNNNFLSKKHTINFE